MDIEGVSTQGAVDEGVSTNGAPSAETVSEAASTETTSPVETTEQAAPAWYDQVSDEELERFLKEHPKGKERASRLTQSEIDRAIALAKQGRMDELHPKLREFVQFTEQRAREASRAETEQEIQARSYYERIKALMDGVDEADPEALETWRSMTAQERDTLRAWRIDYERAEAAKRVDPIVAAEQRAMNAAFVASINALRKGLQEFKQLPTEEQERIIADAFAKHSGKENAYEEVLAEVHAWEAEQRANKVAGSRLAAEAKKAAETSVAQKLMDRVEDPETSKGTGATVQESSEDPHELFRAHFAQLFSR
jgi:hypothetical protein